MVNTGQIVIHHLDLSVTALAGTDWMPDAITTPTGSREIFLTNETKHTIPLQGDPHIVNIQRMPVLSHTFRVIGRIKFSSLFLKSTDTVRITVSTDDSRDSKQFTGTEIFASLVNKTI